jgi:hypothetical protein
MDAVRPVLDLTDAQKQRYAERILFAERDTPGMDFVFYAKQIGMPDEHIRPVVKFLDEVED